MDVNAIQLKLAEFAKERAWDQYHSPKNLSTALMCEAGELAEIFQWMTGDESYVAMGDPKVKQAIIDEMADVQLYLMRLADRLNVNLEEAMHEKIAKSAQRWCSQ